MKKELSNNIYLRLVEEICSYFVWDYDDEVASTCKLDFEIEEDDTIYHFKGEAIIRFHIWYSHSYFEQDEITVDYADAIIDGYFFDDDSEEEYPIDIDTRRLNEMIKFYLNS